MVRSRPFSAGRQTTAALHPSAAELADFALGSLDGERSAVIEGHVYRCDRCADLVARVPGDEFLQELRASCRTANDYGDAGASARSQETIGLPVDDLSLAKLSPEIHNHPRFEIKRLIAEGAMGRVYLAYVRDTTERVAVKVVRPDIADDKRKLDRFLQEWRIAEILRHPNIARMIAYESFGHSAMIAMEFVRGPTLAQVVRQRGPLPVQDASEYVRQVAAGLTCAASRGVVHRDIKPHNLMFESHTRLIKIVDFGLGRLVDEQRSGSRLTRDGEILGTLDYISPEQAADSRNADVRSDIYSLGCTFYFLLAGAPPFQSKNAVGLLQKHEIERPAPIRALRDDIPDDVAELLERMMQKDPALRPQSPQEILEALACLQTAGHDRPDNRFNASAVFRKLAMPAVWLPVLTCLICLMWLLVR